MNSWTLKELFGYLILKWCLAMLHIRIDFRIHKTKFSLRANLSLTSILWLKSLKWPSHDLSMFTLEKNCIRTEEISRNSFLKSQWSWRSKLNIKSIINKLLLCVWYGTAQDDKGMWKTMLRERSKKRKRRIREVHHSRFIDCKCNSWKWHLPSRNLIWTLIFLYFLKS